MMNTQDDSIDADELRDLLDEDEEQENPNEGCLEGMACPKCGSFGPFKIGISAIVEVSDEGVEDQSGDNEWEDSSYCECMECDCSSTVAEFSGKGPAPSKPTAEDLLKEATEALKEMVKLVDDFMPNVGKCAIQNYQRLNEAPIAARAAIAKAEGR